MIRKIVNYPLIFISRYIFWLNKEKTETVVHITDLALITASQLVNHSLCKLSKLVIHDSKVPVPLPNRWTNDDKSLSKQPLYLLIMQLENSILIPATKAKSAEIQNSADKSWTTLMVMDSFKLTTKEEFDVVKVVKNFFDPSKYGSYNILKEIYVGESIVNGENPYILRKFDAKKITYDFQGSKEVEEDYRKYIKNAFQRQTFDQNALEKAGLTKQQLQRAVNSGQNVYSMFFEHFPVYNTPQIFHENEIIKGNYVVQTPYPLFMKIEKDGVSGYICIGIAFRYQEGKQISVFSPFFANQPYKCWKLAQAQLFQAVFNDFHVRVHLGILHLTTNQYNVPIYNTLTKLQPEKVPHGNFKSFLQYAYTMFNYGLEGVNVNAVATLINPMVTYSIVNKVGSISQRILKEIKSQTANMKMGDGKNNRYIPTNSSELLRLFQNLVFCWVCFHAHTWTNIPYGIYYSLRPSMVAKQVPRSEKEWRQIVQGSQLPHPKVMMSASQLLGAVSTKDPNNFIIDRFKKTILDVSYAAIKEKNRSVKQKYQQMQLALNKAIQQLNDFKRQVIEMNEKRLSLKQPALNWMDPTTMECSLNI